MPSEVAEVEAAEAVQEAEQLLRDSHEHEFDVVVIGSGPGGSVAAVRAAQLGGKVALIEKEELGGSCLNRGCIPMKAMLELAQRLRTVRCAPNSGIQVDLDSVSVNLPAMRESVQYAVKHLRTGLEFLLEKNQILWVRGEARFVESHKIEIRLADGGTQTIETANVIIATGSPRARPSIIGSDLPGTFDAEAFTRIDRVPPSVVVIGGGYVGVEFAALFHQLGSQVALIEMQPALLPDEDQDIGRELSRVFEGSGITVAIGTKVKIIESDGGRLNVIADNHGHSKEFSADAVILAVSRRAETDDLGFRKVGIRTFEGNVIVDSRMRTTVPGVYAVGDAVRGFGFAHTAMAEGVVAAENAMGGDQTAGYELLPTCVYLQPEIASVGMTEQKANREGIPVRTGLSPFRANSRAATSGEMDGFVKMVVHEDDNTIIGVHIIGPRATDLIGEATLMLKFAMTISEVAETVHPHPSFSEALVEAALAARGETLHK